MATGGAFSHGNWTSVNDLESQVLSSIAPRRQDKFGQGIRDAVNEAQDAEDIASLFSTSFDRYILANLAGILISQPPTNATRHVTVQVTRIPRAPFLVLILLDAAYALISTVLFFIALIAVRKGDCVADAQARLTIKAVVAESFESPALGDDAPKVDELFAERRGQKMRKVAIVRRPSGGRKFKQVATMSTARSSNAGPEG